MRILVNRQIKHLFICILLLTAGFSLLSVAAVGLELKYAALYVLISAICMCTSIYVTLYLYFRDQEQIMENAITQVHTYLAGDHSTRIDCDDEGELYRLFHEVNSLAAILNAHAENEANTKAFLKNTISNISHQLKTPLAALNVYNGLLQEESKEYPAIREFVHLSEQELDRMETLLQNFLKIAKLDSGMTLLGKAMENVSELMECVERHFAYQARQEEKTLIFCGEDAIVLSCDRVWLIEAISNLVKNALSHTRVGNTIRVEWRQFASIVQIIVRDNGSGIAPEDLPHIFKQFYRSRFAEDPQGVGLGLPLAKAIVEAHNGTIEVDSDQNRGTTFTINFLIPTK